MTNPTALNFLTTTWQSSKAQLKPIREQVFINEQGVPVELEWDDMDETAVHVLAQAANNDEILAIGTARIIIKSKQAYIGRMAVISQWRAQGIGMKLLQHCINECLQRGVKRIDLNAQVNVLPFYQKAGFEICSDEFMDAGIPHKKMTLSLS